MDSPPSEAPRPSATAKKAKMLYFAYGSNIHVAQMARRCPGSVFKGKATLFGYRWQINQRGVANVLESTPDSSVEGFIYLISPKDEKSLDRAEGVSKDFYQKHKLEVTMERHEQYSGFKAAKLSELLEQGISAPPVTITISDTSSVSTLRTDSNNSTEQTVTTSGKQPPSSTEQVKALVYISEGYTTDGVIREEYIGRMRSAVADAIALGVSRSFIDHNIAPHLNLGNEGSATVVGKRSIHQNEQGNTDNSIRIVWAIGCVLLASTIYVRFRFTAGATGPQT